MRVFLLITVFSLLLVKCSETSPDSKTQKKTENKEIKKSIPEKFPKIVFKADQKEKLAEKLKKEPWKSIYLKLKELAAKDYKIPKSDDWDTKEHGHNGEISQANAFIAWFEKDKKAAEKAKVGISYLSDKWENYKAWGINIRMAHPLQHYVAAWDLLQGTGFFSKEEADSLKQKLLSITDKFYKKYVLNNAMRQISMTVAQNNHPIRTAAAIGFVALAFNEETQTKKWLDWAISELDYLLGPKGQYIQEDGGISEGPHYFFFGLTPCISFYIAMENYIDKNRFYLRNCLNRSDKDPWKDHGCIEGQEFKFKNPFRQKLFHNALDWSLSLRLPDGSRAPIADSPQRSPNGTSLLTLFGAPDYMYWDWAENPSDPYGLRGGLDLTLYYLLYGDDSKKDFRPKWTTRFMPKSGYAVFRSGWQKEDLWFLLLGEYGSARKTIHDHVDGTSIMLAAYGESLITDTGYYKPNASKNALTSGAASHNVILIDGLGAPEKGLLDNWGGADSFIENTLMGKKFSWAESRQEYQNTEIIRGVGFVRNKYFVMADRLSSQANKARKYQLRLHAYAGYDLKGMAKIGQYGLEMEKNYAGLKVYSKASQGITKYLEPSYKKKKVPHVHNIDKTKEGDHFVLDSTVEKVQSPDFLTVFAPYKIGDKDTEIEVKALDCGKNSVCWSIKTNLNHDFAWIRETGAQEEIKLASGDAIKSDAAFLIVSLNGDFSFISRGSYISLNQKSLITNSSGKKIFLKE